MKFVADAAGIEVGAVHKASVTVSADRAVESGRLTGNSRRRG